jgi:hypothetical protein
MPDDLNAEVVTPQSLPINDEVAELHDRVRQLGTPQSRPTAMPTQQVLFWTPGSAVSALWHAVRDHWRRQRP